MPDPTAILKEMIEAEENNIKLLENEIVEEPENAAVFRELQDDCRKLIARFKMAITEL